MDEFYKDPLKLLIYLSKFAVVFLTTRNFWNFESFSFSNVFSGSAGKKDDSNVHEPDIEKTIEEDPRAKAHAFFLIAEDFYYKKMYLEAIDNYLLALEYEIHPVFYNNMGCARGAMDALNGAKNDITKAIELDGEEKIFWANRGFVHFEMEKIPQACSDWKKAYALGYDQVNEWIELYCPCRNSGHQASEELPLQRSAPKKIPPMVPVPFPEFSAKYLNHIECSQGRREK